MSDLKADPAIERIEAELRASRTQAWDVEAFLANRHQAKIDALTAPRTKSFRLWQTTKELAWLACGAVGYLTIVSSAGLWLLTGSPVPTREVVVERYYDAEGRLAPPPAPPAYRITAPPRRSE